jgi:GrpB-like predicted nucleotidyltransferase (UPF0157 family)
MPKNLGFSFNSKYDDSFDGGIISLSQKRFFVLRRKAARSWRMFYSAFVSEVKLIISQPKNYAYLFLLSNTEQVTFYPYQPLMAEIAKRIIKRVRTIDSDFKIWFIGSAKLEVLGEKDIDIFVEVSKKEFSKWLPLFVKVFGQPIKKRPLFIEWQFMYRGHNIEVSLVDPADTNFKRSVLVYQALQNNDYLRQEYAELKQQLNHTSVRNYIYQRMKFFDKIIRGEY